MVVWSLELRVVEWNVAKFALVVLVLTTAALHFALATLTGRHTFAVLALGLLVGFIVYFTDRWRPRLYLVGAVYVAAMAVVWVVAGMPVPMVGLVDRAVQAVVVGLCLYLFFEGRRDRTEP